MLAFGHRKGLGCSACKVLRLKSVTQRLLFAVVLKFATLICDYLVIKRCWLRWLRWLRWLQGKFV